MANHESAWPLKKRDLLWVTKIPKPTFEHWKDCNLFELNRDDISGGRGKPTLFGHRTGTKLAIAHKGTKLGLPASIALKLAEKFTDVPQAGRTLGGLFPEGTSWILATADGVVSVVNTKTSDDVALMLKDGNTALNVNEIVSKIKLDIGIVK